MWKAIQQEETCYGCNTCGDFREHIDCALKSQPLVLNQSKIHEHPHAPRKRVKIRCGSNISCKSWNTPLPPPLVLEQVKIHEHTLTLLPREVSFTCNACGIKGKVHRPSPPVIPTASLTHSLLPPRRSCAVEFVARASMGRTHLRYDAQQWVMELEGVPEDEESLPVPLFIVISDNIIIHFSHEHYLRLNKLLENQQQMYWCE
ncbi:unnamed protein product [Arabis nemorensis]|uniref:DC1 domain-containing protein n=1 Tax=Arabis nemorensis TaxID=586526 RepID=A0A565C335_9BRAS|nr:unnamed protein product [Arabis nemorensis]